MTVALATVTVASPLTVRLDGAGTAAPARVVTRGDTYSPAVGARVVVLVLPGGALHVLGGA